MKKKFHEDISRSLIKAVTFRFLVLISDGVIIYAITHRYDVTIGLVVFSNMASSTIYFAHERIWNQIHWGKQGR